MLKAVVYFLSKIPLRALYAICTGIIYPIMYYVVRYRRKIVEKNLRLSFPNYTEAQRKEIEKKFYHHFVDIFAEIIYGYSVSVEEMKERMVIENTELVERFLHQYGGVFFMLSHYGNWEWEAEMSKRFSQPNMYLVSMYRELNNKTMDNLMIAIREKRGTILCEIRFLLRHLVKNHKDKTKLYTYGMISDQKPSLFSQHFWTTFLNQETSFLDGTEQLAARFKYPVIYVHTTSPARGYYRNTFEVLSEHPEQEETFAITEKYARRLEREIIERPELWLWSHNRWKYKRGQKA